jgi:hypothetical protein
MSVAFPEFWTLENLYRVRLFFHFSFFDRVNVVKIGRIWMSHLYRPIWGGRGCKEAWIIRKIQLFTVDYVSAALMYVFECYLVGSTRYPPKPVFF